ncbi:hypothetical protein BW722_01010 [Lawsonia intracellularis]|uniref:CdaR family protein n=1 Tax=Lawsonia intracellularis TaxID=29546 RepID=UPI000976A357|nr:hypothetical protein [Lawsonia intracellularis]OMQ05930.1 hypothetical protein BW722_01010 [Lawsonia intracellularis]
MFLTTSDHRGNWKYFLIAFATALILWYTFNAKEQVERIMDVRLDYKGLPSDLIVTEGQLNKINVRLRGSLEMLRLFSGRELSYTINLSGVTQGVNTIPLSSIQFPELRAYQIIDVIPPRMVLQVDHVKEVELPVTLQLRSSLFSDAAYLEDVHIIPSHVKVRGASNIVSSMNTVIAEVSALLDDEGRVVRDDAPLIAPQFVEVSPPTVNVCFKLGMQRRSISFQRTVLLPEEKERLTTRPERVTIVVSVPQSLLNDPKYISQVHASVDTSILEDSLGKDFDGVKRPIKVFLPAAARLIKVSPDIVTVFRRK